MSDPMNSTVLITGASSGIGAGLAREFARRGLRVALLARRAEQLEALAAELRAAGAKASAHRADVTVDGDIARVVAELAAQGIMPDIVIANAGFGVVGKAQDLSLEDYRRQFETNVFGVLRTLHESLESIAPDPGPLRHHGHRGELRADARRFALCHEQVRGARAGGIAAWRPAGVGVAAR